MSDIQGTSFDSLEQNEAKGRAKLIKVLFVVMIVCLVIETGFAIYFISTNDLIFSIPQYIFRRLLLPTAINVCAYITSVSINSGKASGRMKNCVISISIMAMAGVVSFFHSYFIPLWSISVLGIFFCTIFHDRLLHSFSIIIGAFFVCGACVSHIHDYPDELGISVQFLFVSLAVVVLSGVISRIMLDYSSDMFFASQEYATGEMRYRSGYERDALTKVSSRALLEEKSVEMLKRASIINPICIAIVDIDNFKHINDTYGHENGDIVLKKLGEIMLSIEDKHVVVGRFGGEEFVFVFENGITSPNKDKIDELRRLFAQVEFDFMDEKVSFSGGFAVIEEAISYERAVSLADKALYFSKRNGKNRITEYTTSSSEV